MYVNYKTSKQLKELKYKQTTKMFWVNYYLGHPTNKWRFVTAAKTKSNMLDDCKFSAPTHSEVKKWLREEKKCYLLIDRDIKGWYWYIADKAGACKKISKKEEYYKTYELAEESGITEALNYLNK